MALCMLTGLSTVLAVDKQPQDGNRQESDKSMGLKQTLCERVKDVVAATGETVEIEAIKELEDFSGNTYYIVEFANNGYLICHGETGELVEYSTSAPSPYTGEFRELYYLVPTYYFNEVRYDLWEHIFIGKSDCL